jgi:RND family efflux transporter MFP subunit
MAEALPPSAGAPFSGRIEAQDQAVISFRIAGRVLERPVDVGSQVAAGQMLARLEDRNEQAALRAARAALAAAQSRLDHARRQLDRQRHLHARGITSQAALEAAEQDETAARSGVEAAMAQLRTAEDFVRFTVIVADAPGVVTSVGAEPGEVVAAGQAIVGLARRDGRDAVFDVPASVLQATADDQRVRVRLATGGGGAQPEAVAEGRIREVSPQADPVTRLFRIRVGLTDPPVSFRLGVSVTGQLAPDAASEVAIPAAALSLADDTAHVFVLDPATGTVAKRLVQLTRRDALRAFVATGLAAGEIVVTAGVNSLADGQLVRLPGAEA